MSRTGMNAQLLLRAPRVSLLVLTFCWVSASASAQEAFIDLVPVRASGVEGTDWVTGPGSNEITLLRGDQQVVVEAYISDFAPFVPTDYQIGISCAGLDDGVGDPIQLVDRRCMSAIEYEFAFCYGVDVSRDDFLFSETDPGNIGAACSPYMRCPSSALSCGINTVNAVGAEDLGDSLYLVSFGLDVPAGAEGNYLLDYDPAHSTLNDYITPNIDIDYVVAPATIIVPTGQCCGAAVGGGLQCVDSVTGIECDQLGGTFNPGAVCGGQDMTPPDGIDDACEICFGAAFCDDGNACTNDTCESSFCVNTDVTAAGFCCDPQDGALLLLDDMNQCTEDLCLGNGNVYHDDLTPSDLCCNPDDGSTMLIDDMDPCTVDTCQEDGQVTHGDSPGCAAPTSLTIVPVRASGTEGVDWFQGPGANEITLASAGQDVSLELFISGFGPDQLNLYQVQLDCTQYDSDQVGTLVPILDSCMDAGDFALGFCNGVDTTRQDFVFSDVEDPFAQCSYAFSCVPENAVGATCGAFGFTGGNSFDDGTDRYAVTYGMHVPAGSRGTFLPVAGLDPSATVINNQSGQRIDVDVVNNGIISVPVGACCEPSDGTCTDGLLLGDCNQLGGVFSADATCGQINCQAISGACCSVGDGVCVDGATQLACADQGGEFYQDTSCDDVLCIAQTPTVSQWGLAVLGLLLLSAAKVYYGNGRNAAAWAKAR